MEKTDQTPASLTYSESLIPWLNRAMETLWLLVIILVPLVFLGRSYGEWSTPLSSFELPKITLLRTAAGLIAMLWLLEWALRPGARQGVESNWLLRVVQPSRWLGELARWLGDRPTRWLTIAVLLFFGSTLVSTAFSTSHSVSLWGDFPGQDSYSTYTVVSYGLLFAAIATHLKTEAQLWRLVGAIVTMGVLAGGYAVFQHYSWDFLDLIEPIGHTRSSSTFGRTIFAGAVLTMTIPVTTLTAARILTRRMTIPVFALSAAAGAMVLGVQLLGTVFVASRGPWVGTLAGLVALLVLVAAFAGWRPLSRVTLVLALGAALSLAVLVSPLQSIAERQAESQSNFPSLDAEDAVQRLTSVTSEVRGGLSGRKQIWEHSWDLVTGRPWFGFDDLSFSYLRPLIGYGPEQFRATYLLVSPPLPATNFSPNFLPLEVAHAHNIFLHQAVETGFLGLLASGGIYVAVFALGALIWLRHGGSLPVVHKLVLAGLLATLAGRLVEQMVGVGRVSDIMVFWVLLAALAALPVLFSFPTSVRGPDPAPSKAGNPSITKSTLAGGFVSYRRLPLKWMVVTPLIVALAFLTWTKNFDYVRSALVLDTAAAELRNDDLEGSFSSVSQSIDLSPDVSSGYIRFSQVLQAIPNAAPVPDCSTQPKIPTYRRCLTRQWYDLNAQWAAQRPYDFRAKTALAASSMDLGLQTGDTALQDESARLYQEAAEMVPNSWVLWNRLANVLIRLNRSEAALDALDNSLAITASSPQNSIEALRLQGTAYRQAGQPDSSLRSLDQAILLNPEFSFAFQERGLVYYQLGQTGRALEDLSDAIRFDGQSSLAYFLRGEINYEQDRLQPALTDFTNAIDIDPRQPLSWNSRGLVLADLGELSLAIQDFSEAILLDPSFAAAYNNRGFVYRDGGQLESALEDLDRAIELDAGLVNAYYNRTLTNILLGRDAEAQHDVNRVVALGYDPESLVAEINQLELPVKP